MKILIPPKDIDIQSPIKLPTEKSHHLLTVMRCKIGDTIEIIDGNGKAYKGLVSDVSKKTVFVRIIEELKKDLESEVHLILCQGILKGENTDLVIQKATELGVKEITPIFTERTVVRQTRRLSRWQKIAEEAVEQCGRLLIPKIKEPMKFEAMLESFGKLKGFIFWEEGGISLIQAIKKINLNIYYKNQPVFILIGSEGGFTQQEIEYAEKAGLVTTTLGKRILRAETASITAVSLVLFLLENKV